MVSNRDTLAAAFITAAEWTQLPEQVQEKVLKSTLPSLALFLNYGIIPGI
jgi:hypothetical protein